MSFSCKSNHNYPRCQLQRYLLESLLRCGVPLLSFAALQFKLYKFCTTATKAAVASQQAACGSGWNAHEAGPLPWLNSSRVPFSRDPLFVCPLFVWPEYPPQRRRRSLAACESARLLTLCKYTLRAQHCNGAYFWKANIKWSFTKETLLQTLEVLSLKKPHSFSSTLSSITFGFVICRVQGIIRSTYSSAS